jgi:tRNA-dihydrouridine synthase B
VDRAHDRRLRPALQGNGHPLGAAYVATEMVACAEFARGRPDVVRRAAVGDGLPLMVVQLVGRDPDLMAQGARMAADAGAQIIDLNFGCPPRKSPAASNRARP